MKIILLNQMRDVLFPDSWGDAVVDGAGHIKFSGEVMGKNASLSKIQEHNGCSTQPPRRGATLYHLVCNINRMLLY